MFALDFTNHPAVFERDASDAGFPPAGAPWIIRQCAAGQAEIEKAPLKLNMLLFKAQFQKDCAGLAPEKQSELRSISKSGDRRASILEQFGPCSDDLLCEAGFSENMLVAG